MPVPPPPVVVHKSITASTSGSASPKTTYGSFPPSLPVAPIDHHLTTTSLLSPNDHHGTRTRKNSNGNGNGKRKGNGKGRKWDWETNAKVVNPRHSFSSLGAGPVRPQLGNANGVGAGEGDLYDSDADLITTDEGSDHEDEDPGQGTERPTSSHHHRSSLLAINSSGKGGAGIRRVKSRNTEGLVKAEEEDKQWGVLKMEAMGRFWGKRGLCGIYAGVYLISTLTSLEANTTPTIEPYFLSLLKSHSLLGAIAIVTNIAYAVGKPPLTKVLDVFGRAEGIVLAATLYSLGFLLTASATDVKVFIFGRAIAALGGQGLQLAQQIIIADTSTLTNRGLITSTISLPWLITTWAGPPLGAVFQKAGAKGYRLAYALFGILLPVAAGILACTLLLEWRKTKSRLNHGYNVVQVERGSQELFKGIERVREGSSTSWTSKWNQLWKQLDVVGLVALTIGCTFVLLPLTLAAKRPSSWADVEIYSYMILGFGALAFFGLYEFRCSSFPLLPPRLLLNKTIMCGSALGFFHFTSQFVYESFFTSFLQVARNHSPVDASYISQSYIFSASIAAIVAGLAAKITQRYKWIGVLGVLIHMVGTWLMMRARNLDSSTFELVASQVIGGVGGGFTTLAGQIGCQSVVGHQDVGIATAIFLTITSIGGALGGAVAGAIWSTLLPSQLCLHLPPSSQDLIPDIMASLSYTLSFPVGDPIRIAIDRSYVTVQKRLNWVAIIILIPALIAVMGMKNVHLEKEDQGQGEGVVVLGRASILRHEDDHDVTSSETSSLLGGSDPETSQARR